MVLIPGGKYLAGVDPDRAVDECKKYYDKCRRDWFMDEDIREVEVKSFYMDPYEVTQGDFFRIMGNNPSRTSYKKISNLPVENVIWAVAVEYCRRVGKRLPTEWEWEKAAKGGGTSLYYWGDDPKKASYYAWYDENSNKSTHRVGTKKPNAYGLYDMAGNVWEWTATNYDAKGKYKVLRGGSWINFPYSLRVSTRLYFENDEDNLNKYHFGFRCASDKK